MVLGDDTVRVIWAYHHKKPKNKHHIHHHGHNQRGVRSLHLRELPKPKMAEDSSIKTWELRGRNVRLPNDDHTHYFCQIFKAPTLDVKHHMVGVCDVNYEIRDPFKHRTSCILQILTIT